MSKYLIAGSFSKIVNFPVITKCIYAVTNEFTRSICTPFIYQFIFIPMSKLLGFYLLLLVSTTVGLENDQCSKESFKSFLQSYSMKCGEECKEYIE